VDPIAWLLDSDPSIRWQTLRDLTYAGPDDVRVERARVAQEGLGANILALQHPDGGWHREVKPLWLTTLFTLMLLRSTGIDPHEPKVVAALDSLESNLRWSDEPNWNLRPDPARGNVFFDGEEEPCINGSVLALGGYFGRPSVRLARRLLGEQLADGGWNCDAPKSTRSSFHSTICVLEGLLEYDRAVGGDNEVAAARARGEEYLLKRSLMRRLSTGEVVDPAFQQFAFPPRYHYDVLRALDYFRAVGEAPDPRLQEGIRLVESKQQPDGRWLLEACHDEALAFSFDEEMGDPSRWNTLRALRVTLLRWRKGYTSA
jgi:hypothetical protein